ncbi:MAG: hypothetical protein GY835_04280 [bacterium]|nr:hypothetical protein [bacterium]
MRFLIITILSLSLAAPVCLALETSSTTAATGPILDPDNLTSEQRMEMEAELASIRAEIARLEHTWTAGETSYLRLSREERDRRLIQTPWPEPIRGATSDYIFRGFDRDSNGLDWRNNDGDFVTGIRNQGECGSCWDFAATGSLESAFLISIGGGNVPDFDLSEQHVLSCMDDYGFGSDCGGGNAADVYWFATNVGMIEEFCLPYQGNDSYPCGEICDDSDERSYTFDSYGTVCSGLNIEAIKDALHNHGPVATTMTVYDTFDAYTGGIYEASGSVTGYHAVTIIGYNDTHRYWIAKNSWGQGWGLGGFFMMSYDSGCSFGNWTTYSTHNSDDMGSFAAFRVNEHRPHTGDPVHFYNRSVEINATITNWEWDFDGNGTIDATGPGPHIHIYTQPGIVSPWLRITDSSGQQDIADYTDLMTLIFDGPVWTIDDVNGSDYGDGSPGNPLKRIQMGMNVAAAGDTVLVKPGVYSGIMNNELKAYGKDFVLKGDGALGDIVIDGQGSDQLLLLNGGEGPGCSIENFVLRNGFDNVGGGAAFIDESSPSFVGCRFENCTVDPNLVTDGGAVWSNGDASFTDCVFQNNTSLYNGGAIHAAGGTLTLTLCDFIQNGSDLGGAVSAESSSTLNVDNTTFSGNSAESMGGAVYVQGQGEFDACLFTDNQILGTEGFAVGGGLALPGAGSILVMRNCILTGNTAPMGGALFLGDLSSSSARLDHLSFWNNQATTIGGAMVVFGEDLQTRNSIFWSDDALNNSEIMSPGVSATAFRSCIIQGGHIGENIIDQDPMFVDPVNGNFRLDIMSPGIGIGVSENAPPTDFFGEPRPQPEASQPDLGACESPLGDEVGVEEEMPTGMHFVGIYPNPFNPTTTISFSLQEEGDVLLRIYLTTGRLVAALLDERMSSGRHDISWTALDENGNQLASALFLVRLECRYPDGREEIKMQKAILIK